MIFTLLLLSIVILYFTLYWKEMIVKIYLVRLLYQGGEKKEEKNECRLKIRAILSKLVQLKLTKELVGIFLATQEN